MQICSDREFARLRLGVDYDSEFWQAVGSEGYEPPLREAVDNGTASKRLSSACWNARSSRFSNGTWILMRCASSSAVAMSSGEHGLSPTGDRQPAGQVGSQEVPRHARFSRYSERERTAIRNTALMRETAATAYFGPHVLRYAKQHLDDPRMPRTLHRLVFATRHACHRAPGEVSREAFELLHRHFPASEWAEKTPYWYGEID